jgi:hypothetical protein
MLCLLQPFIRLLDIYYSLNTTIYLFVGYLLQLEHNHLHMTFRADNLVQID